MVRGTSDGESRFGLFSNGVDLAAVNGFVYIAPARFDSYFGLKRPPSELGWRLLLRLHPKAIARSWRARRAFARRAWREDLTSWDTRDKPHALRRHRELLAVELETLTDAALLAHLEECDRHFENMVEVHHRYSVPSSIPIGELVVRTCEWTGRSPGEALSLLRGSSPATHGYARHEQDELVRLLRQDPSRLEGTDPTAILRALREAPGELGEAARTYFARVWHCGISYDPGDKSIGEMPDMLVAMLKGALAEALVTKVAEQEGATRDAVPQAARAEFDEILAEARRMNRFRDERGLFADCAAAGILRRATLELGRRLEGRGKLAARSHALDVSLAEARALLVGTTTLSPEDVHQRVVWRETKTVADAPPTLGEDLLWIPPASAIPKGAQASQRALNAYRAGMFGEPRAEKPSDSVVRGVSVNEETCEGTARVIKDVADISRLQKGDVLVTKTTGPGFNVVLPLISGIVTDRGGQLSHAAIVAREYRIPGIVATKDATTRIPDGARVLVDGRKGEVRILWRP
jgi:pyruvate,water dikinase